MVCSSCGTENRPGRKFCGGCAAPLALVCPSCGTAKEPDMRFCGESATPLVAGTTPSQTNPPPPWPTCPGRGARLRTPARHDPLRRPRWVHDARRGSRCRGHPGAPLAVLRTVPRRDRSLRRDGREVHRRRGHGGLGRAHRSRGRCRARRSGGAGSRRRHQVAGSDDRGAGRGPDRRGGCNPRRDQPGDGGRRPRQHGLPAPVCRSPWDRARRRGDAAGRVGRDRLRGCRRTGPEGQDRARPGLACPARRGRARWPKAG